MKKRIYKKPEVKSIRIDNQISMVMMSDVPPSGPGETQSILQNNTADPYKIARG